MDRITISRNAIMAVINEYIDEHATSLLQDGLQHQSIVNNDHLRFQVVLIGWHDRHRIHSLIFHLDIIDDKIWIQDDNLEYSVAERLVDQGISKKDIVLAYFSPSHREYTEYAVS